MTHGCCPACGASVDPYLGPAPLVVGDRVVMCCQEACAQALCEGSLRAKDTPQGEAALPTSTEDPGVEVLVYPGGGAGTATEVEPSGELLVRDLSEASWSSPSTSKERAQGGEGAEQRPGVLGGPLSWRQGVVLAAAGVFLVVLVVYLVMAYATAAPRASEVMLSSKGQVASDAISDAISDAGAHGVLARAPPEAVSAGLAWLAEAPHVLALRQRSVVALEAFLESDVIRFRLLAADVLAETGGHPAVTLLKEELGAPLWTTRQMAAEILARLGHTEGLDTLREGLTSPRTSIRWGSAYALARVGDPSGAQLLRQIAHVRIHRMTANEALARLGDPRSLRFLREVLAGDAPAYERRRAAVALGLVGDAAALPLLEASLDEPGMRLGVALALERLGSALGRPALWLALAHAALRVEAARALRRVGDVASLTSLAPLLDSGHPETRLSGAASIVILSGQPISEATAWTEGP